MSEAKSGSIGSMLKLGLILSIFAVVACTCLAVVNNITAPVIEKNNIEKANKAMKSVFAEAESFKQVTDFAPSADSSVTIDKFYVAETGGKAKGVVVQVTGPTYDKATLVAGFDLNGIVTGVQFLALTDSPGFGLKANDSTYTVKSGSTFYGQFTGKNAADGFTAGVTFDAISGATITSNGVAGLLTAASGSALSYLEGLR